MSFTDKSISFSIPYPKCISTNHYLKRGRRKVYLNPKVNTYREEIYFLSKNLPKSLKGNLKLKIEMFPPDNRIRDIDNICKSTLDALQYAQIYENDSQISELHIVRHYPVKPGKLDVTITYRYDENKNNAT